MGRMAGSAASTASTAPARRPGRRKGGKSAPEPTLDETDRRIIIELAADSSVSVPKLSKKVGVSTNAAYARIDKLRRRGIIRRYSIAVDGRHMGYGVKAVLGINMDIKRRGAVVDSLMDLPEVSEVAEVTGRFDLLVTLHARSLEDMHRIVYGRVGRIAGILSSESFLQMKSRDKAMSYMPSRGGTPL